MGRRLSWGSAGLTLFLVATTIALAVVNRASIRSPDDANAIQVVLPIGFGILGWLVTLRQPGSALGWASAGIAVAMAVSGVTRQYARFAVLTQPDAPFTPWLAVVGQVAEIIVYPAGLAAFAFLVTPNGRLISPAWRWVTWAGVATTAVLVVFTATELDVGDPAVPNPAGLVDLARLSAGPVGIVTFLVGLLVLLVAGASVMVRLHRATGDERLQLRWIAAGGAVAIVANAAVTVFAILFLSPETSDVVITVATTIGFGVVLPASFGVAILRYRLYDIDLLLNRTVLFGATGVLLAAGLFVANLLVQRGMEVTFGEPSDVVTVALGIAAGMAFGPIRRAMEPMVDRALPPRGRLAMLFTDIVESTRTIVDVGDERWRELLVDYREVVRRELARHRGREVNTAGDAFFAVFTRPADGVAAALALRQAVGSLGLRTRTGVHWGEVETRGEQVTGLAVHAAARVMALAEVDQVLVTDAVADGVADTVSVRPIGTRSLRGVPGEWHLFAVD